VGDPARNYFIVRKGKVILEFEEDGVLQCCEEVGPGMGAGCCCLAGMKCYRCHAYCQESCQLLCWSQSALRHLFNQNSRIGYLMIKALAKKLSKRVPRKVDLPSVANA
jgi:CRP-like cAMP-binding protein